ncbi:MAG: hypothetical protein LPK19_05705 [Hymenobacteraceae bacterium]|nr:hypothetical protein [Hymenobacteraceae bacterium]MDX5395695.1 hypothetical protein [Hymenobacteraceae bacterium]MDX5511749.1 hypothetical protein [Hymenobacteraceae bacterium]
MRVVTGGIETAEIKKKNVNPLHGLALSQYINPKAFTVEEVDFSTALRFLHKEDIPLQQSENGWVLIQYKGRNLGWLKKLSNRTNNYYPKEWRIRMSIDEALQHSKPEEVFAVLPIA